MTEGLEHADFATQRQLLRLLVNRIEVDQDAVRIVYKVQPRPFEDRPANRGVLQDCLKFHTKAQGRERSERTLGSPPIDSKNPGAPGFHKRGQPRTPISRALSAFNY